jgi:hypothetical protein
LDIDKIISAINADFEGVRKARIVAYDPAHFYLFKDGFDGLNRTGSRAIPISPFEIEALYWKLRQSRIDAALERMASDLRGADAGSVVKAATGYGVTEGGETTMLNESQFIDLAQARGYIPKDDPFFV